jgi:uracil-DNA glycosylase
LSSTSEQKAARALGRLASEIGACRICVETPRGRALPHEPRPVVRPSATARLVVCGQAPGVRVHASGVPFTDPSGVRLRAWMGVTDDEFYDTRCIAIVPMGFCFPGHDAMGGDRPPRKECADAWHERLFSLMPQVELILAVDLYAQCWHLGDGAAGGLTATVARWRVPQRSARVPGGAEVLPLPHPSWRNNAWIKANPWFGAELLPELRQTVRRLIAEG